MKYSELSPAAQEVAKRLYEEAVPEEDRDPQDLEVYAFNSDGTPEDN